MGVGVYAKGGNYARYEMFKAKPGVILLSNPDVEFIREVRRLFPKAFIVGRRFVASQPLDNPRQRGVAFADYVAEIAVPAKGLVDAWMSYNEPIAFKDYNGYRAYNEFQVAFAERLQNHHGIPAVAGNDAPGAIDVPEYPQHFAEAIRASRYFGVHAYTSRDATTFREKDVDWYMLRYRKIHDALETAGIGGVKMVVTEAAFVDGWHRRNINDEQMAAEFMWLADEMYKDDYAIGFAAYGIFVDPGPWQAYQLAGTNALAVMGGYEPPTSR